MILFGVAISNCMRSKDPSADEEMLKKVMYKKERVYFQIIYFILHYMFIYKEREREALNNALFVVRKYIGIAFL